MTFHAAVGFDQEGEYRESVKNAVPALEDVATSGRCATGPRVYRRQSRCHQAPNSRAPKTGNFASPPFDEFALFKDFQTIFLDCASVNRDLFADAAGLKYAFLLGHEKGGFLPISKFELVRLHLSQIVRV